MSLPALQNDIVVYLIAPTPRDGELVAKIHRGAPASTLKLKP